MTILERSWRHDDRVELHGLTEPGPWQDEPDKVQWVDEATGLDCLVNRNRSGAWCGYVGVPPGHPAFGASYGGGLLDDIDVHGGLTFGDTCQEDAPEGYGVCHVPFPGRPADVFWHGFDCAHAFDLIPAFLKYRTEDGRPIPMMTDGKYRDLAYVRAQTEDLARQLADMGGDAGQSGMAEAPENR